MSGSDDGTVSGENGGENGDSSSENNGHLRLEGELGGFRAEFESLAAEVDTDADGSERNWVARGRGLIGKADEALTDGRIEQGWYYLHAAERLAVYGIEEVGGREALEGEARELLIEAKHSSLSWRADAVKERLKNEDGTLKEVTGADVRAAYELLHKGYQSVHLKRQHLQSQFSWLKRGAILAIAGFVLFALVSVAIEAMPSPFFRFSHTALAAPEGYLIYVVLSGTLGATLFGLRSLKHQSTSGSVPQYLTGFQVSLARVLVGAGSALAVFFLLRAELLSVNVGAGTDSGPFLIALAFTAGYSERLVHTTVESVASSSKSSAEGDGA